MSGYGYHESVLMMSSNTWFTIELLMLADSPGPEDSGVGEGPRDAAYRLATSALRGSFGWAAATRDAKDETFLFLNLWPMGEWKQWRLKLQVCRMLMPLQPVVGDN